MVNDSWCCIDNNIFYLAGEHDHCTAKKLLSAIFQVVTKKCCEIINSKPFFGLLTDKSQARKTGTDKEMILLKTDYKGLYDFLYES